MPKHNQFTATSVFYNQQQLGIRLKNTPTFIKNVLGMLNVVEILFPI